MHALVSGASPLSRRRFVQIAAAAAAGASGPLVWPAGSVASAAGAVANQLVVPPTPIPGGIQLPAAQIHVWVPGDPTVTLPFSHTTLMGFDVEPSTFTNRQGFSAVAFHAGTATASDGVSYNLETDIRVFAGSYVASDGVRRFGKFALI